MMRAMIALIAIAVSGCAGEPLATDGATRSRLVMDATPEQVEAGRRIVELQCVSCHAVRGEDKSHDSRAPALRTLAERYPVTGLEEAFAQGIMIGHPGMPEFRFNRDQISDILVYLESIQTHQGAALAPRKSSVAPPKASIGRA